MNLASLAFPMAKPLLSRLEPETAHRLTMKLLAALPMSSAGANDPRLESDIFGMRFPNPLGLAAGFDKNAEVPDAMLGLGFGFVETGTVTPRAQEGNPRPRLFRLAEDQAVINRMGFNNEGHKACLVRLDKRKGRGGIVGVNLGANKDSSDRIGDYVMGIARFAPVADYFTINISSPNTPGLRALQSRAELNSLLARLNAARAEQPRKPPMLLKIAPDLAQEELEDVAMCCGGGAVDGIIVSNTTISRPALASAFREEQGGLSGEPLFELSTRQLARLFLLTEGRIPLVGAGGIHDAETAWTKIRAGASLLQLYTALVFQGPRVVMDVLEGLAARLADASPELLAGLVGADAERIAHQGLSGT